MNLKKVVVAMSRGVDSSVNATLLIKKRFDVIGITMRLGLQDSTRTDYQKFKANNNEDDIF